MDIGPDTGLEDIDLADIGPADIALAGTVR
jgi:hypothetical protein